MFGILLVTLLAYLGCIYMIMKDARNEGATNTDKKN